MSGRYVSRVLESDLPAHLSKTAEACATFADDGDGSKVKPSMKYLAWLTKQGVRTVQRHMHELIAMEVLVELNAATQHRPAHYRMDLTKLPARPPFRLPEVQLVAALEPDSGVPHVTPLDSQGCHLDRQGCQYVAPDPSMDPKNVHTPRAREPEVPSVAPLSADLALVGPTPPPRCRHPHAHAWCEGRVHVPRDLHFELLDKLGTRPGESPAAKAGRLVAFYADTMHHLSPEASIGDAYAFWKAAYHAWVHTDQAPAVVRQQREVSPEELADARRWAEQRLGRDWRKSG